MSRVNDIVKPTPSYRLVAAMGYFRVRHSLTYTVILATAAASVLMVTEKDACCAEKRSVPNIVLIMADDK